MTQIYINEIANHDGKEVTLKGWLYNKRSSGKIKFIILRDGTGLLQCVAVKGEVDDKTFDMIEDIPQESSIKVTGTVREDKRSPLGYELTLKDIEVIQLSEEYPISKKEHGTAFLMDHRHLWLRSEKQRQILKIRAELVHACRQFYYERGFVLIDSPILTPASVEGTSTLFETDYFDGKAYLSQSGQLYLEPALAAFGKVYCFGPTFRAEKSKTRRHLQEFWMIEPEVAFADHDDNIKLAEEFVSYIVEWVIEKCSRELESLERNVSKLEAVKPPFNRITYSDTIDRLKKEGQEIEWGDDFGAEHETIVGSWSEKPTVIEKFPAKIKPFYMQPDEDNPDYVLNIDVIAPEGYGEIIGGSQRDHDHDRLKKKLIAQGLPVESYQWYLDVRRYGSVPHSGFGLGIERVIAWVTGIKHIRETIPYPRMLHRLYP